MLLDFSPLSLLHKKGVKMCEQFLWHLMLLSNLQDSRESSSVQPRKTISLKSPEEQLNQQLREYQGQFRKGFVCNKQIMNLKYILSYLKLRNKKLMMTFGDFKKTYSLID